MDPLANFTALSPQENEPLLSASYGDSEDVTSLQCSADPNAFAGLSRPFSGVVPQRSTGSNASGDGPRLPLNLGGSVSQLSQFSTNSQSTNQFHEAFLQDTQHDECSVSTTDNEPVAHSERKNGDDGIAEERQQPVHRLRDAVKSTGTGGGFLSALEQQRWAKIAGGGAKVPVNATPSSDGGDAGDDDAMDVDADDDGVVECREQKGGVVFQSHDRLDGDDEPVVRGGGFLVDDKDKQDKNKDEDDREAEDPDATPRRIEEDFEGDERHSDAGSDGCDHDSMDSLPDTQVLEEDLEGEQDVGEEASDHDQAMTIPNTEAFPETMDQEEEEEKMPNADEVVDAVPATPEDQPISTKATEAVVGSARDPSPRFLKRKQKARDSLRHDAEPFVDTEDQTLTELAARIRRERTHATIPPVPVPSSKKALWQSQDDSQEDSPPTQPSKETHHALKKRGKVDVAVAPLSDSQERSYEFIDSSCQCGEAVCQCHGATPSPSLAAKPTVPRASSAMRNLEFAFAIPESQDSESQQFDSLPDVGALALKTLQASRLVEQQPQRSPEKEVSTSTHESPLQKRENPTPASAAQVTPKKARKATTSSPSKVPTTPVTNRKRGRTFLSPDAGTDPARSTEVTPRKAPRSDKPPVAPPGSSTPSVRTRARILSSIPSESSRSYASRTKSLFKARFEFCLTGFTGEGQANLAKLIEDYGGRVWDRHHEVLQKKPNNRAVVVATSVSWRKLKFMYAIACGIPVVHPEWVHACIKQRQIVPFDGYCVPSGCSVTTGKFECLPVKELSIFQGLTFGIPLDVQPSNVETTKNMSDLTTFILRACGAAFVQEDLAATREKTVDVVLADEFTKVCEYHARKHHASVKTFAWVTECMILQRFLDPKEVGFSPQPPLAIDSKARGVAAVMAVTAEIGDSEQTTLKLHTGELLLVDLSAEGKIDHFLLFDVCEILSIHVTQASSAESHRRKPVSSAVRSVRLHVGVLERRPNSPALSRRHTRVIDLSPEKVKRRVVAVSKADFDAMRYRDESIFYYEEE